MTTRGTWLMFVFVLLSGCMGPAGRPWPSEQPSGTNIPSGKLDFGPWEQIFYGEFDGCRKKRVLVKIIGE